MKYIGDLSSQDAALLERYARSATSVLEFGVGGSTQIIAQALSPQASFTSLDTDPKWIEITQSHLSRLGVNTRCQMLPYEAWIATRTQPPLASFDLIFNDGLNTLRRDFAVQSFPLLTVGGVLLFHDTRRSRDVRYVLDVVATFFEEVEHVHLNERFQGASSNITAIRKKPREPYVDWNLAEGRPPWAYGLGEVPEDFWSK